MLEIWKEVEGFERYSVSNKGQVKNNKTHRVMTLDENNCGYFRVALNSPRRKRYFIHRLVAIHFIENPEGKKFVNHIDGDKANNCIQNLEWVTQSENEIHTFENNLKDIVNRRQVNVTFNDGREAQYKSLKHAGEEIGVSFHVIGQWCRGASKGYLKYGIANIS